MRLLGALYSSEILRLMFFPAILAFLLVKEIDPNYYPLKLPPVMFYLFPISPESRPHTSL
jgi:hypothetical protein